MTTTKAPRLSVCQNAPSRVRRNRQRTSIQPPCSQIGAMRSASVMSRDAMTNGLPVAGDTAALRAAGVVAAAGPSQFKVSQRHRTNSCSTVGRSSIRISAHSPPAKTERGLARKIDRNRPPSSTNPALRAITASSFPIDRARRHSAIFCSTRAEGTIGNRAPGRRMPLLLRGVVGDELYEVGNAHEAGECAGQMTSPEQRNQALF